MKCRVIGLIAVLLLISFSSYIGAEGIEEEIQEKENQIQNRAERLSLAILRRDYGVIAEHSEYEGFSSSKGYRIDKFFEDYHGDHYTCVEIEILSVEFFPGPTERAEVTVRSHFSVSPPHDMPAARVDVWEFVNKRGQWLLVLRKL